MRLAAADAAAAGTSLLFMLAPSAIMQAAEAFVVPAPAGTSARSSPFSRSGRTGSVAVERRASVSSGRSPSATATATARMAIAAPGDDAKVVVCGPADGIAGLVAARLSAVGGIREVVLADETESLEEQLLGAKVVIGSSDGGPSGEEAPAGLADEIVAALPDSSEYLIWVDSPEGRKASKLAKLEIGVLGSLLGGGFKESLEAVRSVEGNVKCVVVHAGRLFGAARGEEPVPFLTGPKAEPVLDESITRQAVLVGPGTVLSSPEDAATKRSSVADAIERFVDGPERKRGLELSVVSVEGFATTDEEWQEELKRLDDSEGVAVFSIDFDAIEKKDQLMKWLTESWGPAALRKSTAGMLRSGARPVAVAPTPAGLELVWETLTEDLNAVQAGKLSLVVNDEPAGIRVVRVAGPGQPQGKGLSGEEEIVQSLLEGINTVAYPKALVTRKVLKVSRAAAEAAMSAAAAAGPAAAKSGAVARETVAAAAPTPATAQATAGGEEPEGGAAAAPSPRRKGRGRRSGGKRKSS
ncbi:unnamed protein product [Pylaiella littoralis]